MRSVALQRVLTAKTVGIVAGWLLLSMGAAHAQSCVQQSDTATRCTIMLSQPRAFTVDAKARLVHKNSKAAQMTIAVNGRPCRGTQHTMSSLVWAECHIELPANASVIEARVYAQNAHTNGVKIGLAPNHRLSSLPIEVGNLYPKDSRDGFWSNFWPFP